MIGTIRLLTCALAALSALAACGKDGGGAGATRDAAYTLYARADVQEPPGGVRVAATVPTAWKELAEPMGPSFEVAGLDGIGGPALVLIQPRGDDDDARLAKAIALQYDEAALAAATREDRPDGRVWIDHRPPSGGVHARMFLPAAEGVVMCVIFLTPGNARRLAELQPFCESVRLAD